MDHRNGEPGERPAPLPKRIPASGPPAAGEGFPAPDTFDPAARFDGVDDFGAGRQFAVPGDFTASDVAESGFGGAADDSADDDAGRDAYTAFDAFAATDAFAKPSGLRSVPAPGAQGPGPMPAPEPPSDNFPVPMGTVTPFGVPSSAGAASSLEPVNSFDSTAQLARIPRSSRDPLALTAAEPGGTSGGNAHVRRVVTPEFLLTVNPVDGTEVTDCPPEERVTPVRRTRDERMAHSAAARPTPPPGPPAPELPLLERDEERERLIRLLARGRSIRVTGPSGAGRTALLESVANACGDLAPDGVLWLTGYRRTPADLMHDLYSTVYAGEGYRPGREELPGLLHNVGAVVVIDDLEFGGSGLEELLSAAPECAFLMSATPDVGAPATDSMIDEVFLSGLTRVACLDLLQLVAGRRLEEDETAWAADLWFESEGLPLRFVQAGALLRQRDTLRQPVEPAEADWDDSVWENGSPASAADEIPDLTGFDLPEAGEDTENGPDTALPGAGIVPLPIPGRGAGPGVGPGTVAIPPPPAERLPASAVPLPSLAESAAPADLLASRLSESAREALAFAVALDGECPNPAHLPALVGDTHGDAALGELTSVGLAVPVAAHFRLAAGVVQQMAGPLSSEGELSEVQAHTAALHYAWWTGHPSVTPQRAAAESEAIIAAMTACRDGGHASAAVLLARTVAPVFAAALAWGAWERTLRVGQEAARLSGEVAEEAYFHHELGVLALCTGNLDRARAELEASIALRGALADRRGTLVGRRTLALVNDRAGTPGLSGGPYELPPAEADTTAPLPEHGRHAAGAPLTVISKRPQGQHAAGTTTAARRLPLIGSRRNLVAVSTGVVLAAILGTIVAVGSSSGSDGKSGPNQVQPIESAQQAAPDDSDSPAQDPPTTGAPSSTSASPSTSATTTSTAPVAGVPSSTGGTSTSPTPDAPTTTVPHTTPPTTGGTTGGHSTTGGGSGGSTGGGTTGGSTTGSTTDGGTTGTTTTGGTTGTTTTGGTTGTTTTGGTTGTTTTGGTTGSTTDGGTTGTTTTGGTTGTTTTGGTTGTTTTGGTTGQ